MTDYDMNAEPGRYEVHGRPAGMGNLVARWRRLKAERWAAAVKGQGGLVAGRAVIAGEGAVGPPPVERTDLPRQPDAGVLGIEGQKPGVEEGLVKLPELLIPATIVAVGDRVAEGQLIEAVMLPWFDIVKALERDPNFVHQLVKNWRIMEELVAGAYHQEGWSDVILTPRSGDRGRDIIVSRPDWGTIRIYDQVKAYSPDHPVPAADVRELFGVLVRDQNVSKAVLTTTTLFAPGVCEEWAAFIPYRLELRDGPALTRWLLGLLPGRS
jgi:restriction system protein